MQLMTEKCHALTDHDISTSPENQTNEEMSKTPLGICLVRLFPEPILSDPSRRVRIDGSFFVRIMLLKIHYINLLSESGLANTQKSHRSAMIHLVGVLLGNLRK